MHARQGRVVSVFVVAALCLSGMTIADTASARKVSRAEKRPAEPTGPLPQPDTVYVGFASGHATSANPWSIWSGQGSSYGHAPSGPAVWTWDGIGPQGDSLFGWTPVREANRLNGGQTLNDKARPHWGLDHGNQANYRLRGGNSGRRIGVVGVWHADNGAASQVNQPGLSPIPPSWTAIAGTRSAWCGLRAHGDLTAIDPSTGAYFNEDVLSLNAAVTDTVANPHRFPGYASQWDQMLYRDFVLADGASLAIAFKYRSRLSTGAVTAAATRTGWFHGDPLSVALNDGNFISSSDAGANAPIDSFQVYVGVPVNDAACRYSDGNVAPVHDKQRRWFSEVLRIFEGMPHYRIFATAGSQPASTGSPPVTVSIVIPNAQVQPILNAQAGAGGTVRLVFRVKTNRGFDDENGDFDSNAQGAVIVDDVVVNGSAAAVGDFESPTAIDNSIAVTPTAAWKSTGKPPGLQPHAENISFLLYEDVLGAVGSPDRQCDLQGGVVSMGDHDLGEAAGGTSPTERDRTDAIVSPTIQLAGPFTGPGSTNTHGLHIADVNPTDDYYVTYDVYDGLTDPRFMANSYQMGVQCYPVNDRNGKPGWGQIRYTPYQHFTEVPLCMREADALRENGLIVTSNVSGIPDSIRVSFRKTQECLGFTLALCSADRGLYLDNVSLALVNGTPPPRADSCGTEGWRYLSQTSPPPARSEHAMVSMSLEGIVFMFAGQGDGGLLDDQWEWDGEKWNEVNPSQSPDARAEHAMAYDAWRNTVVMFGGRLGSGPSGETWEWSNPAWLLRSNTGPAARYAHAMAYDPERHMTVMFGGYDGNGVLGDLWEWNGSTWISHNVSPSPPARRDAVLVNDDGRGRMYLIGGKDGSGAPITDVWEWNGEKWTELDNTDEGEHMSAAAAYGGACSHVVLYGNETFNGNETKSWNGQVWFSKLNGLGARAAAGMAYDDPHNRIILFGGGGSGEDGPHFNDTWAICCDCDSEEMFTDSTGAAINPFDIDFTEPISFEDVDETTGYVDEIYGDDHDTSTDMWYPNDECDRTIGGTIMPEDTTRDILQDLADLGIVGTTQEEIADTLYAWANLIADKVLGEDDDWENQGPVMDPYTPPVTPHVPPAGGCYVFGGRDLIFIHGLRLTPLKERILYPLYGFTFPTDWNPPDAGDFPGRDDNPQYYDSGYWKQGAMWYWENHIQRFLTDKGIKNRYLIVAWPSTMRLKDGIKAVLTQIGDAMQYGTGVVDPSGNQDSTKFGTPSFVVVSHSTGGLITDAAMKIAQQYPNLGATHIPQLCKGQVALQCAFSGSHEATAAVAAAYFYVNYFPWQIPGWVCPLVNKTFELLGMNAPTSTCPLTGPGLILNSVLVDLVPPVSQLKWGGKMDNSPIRTLTVGGGHPTYTRPVKHTLLMGFDDGVLSLNSQSANNNLFLFGPSGYARTTKRREVRDQGIEEARRRGYFLDQMFDTGLFTPSELVCTGATAYTSMTGMLQPIGYLYDRGSGSSPFARYGGTNTVRNHFSFLEAASDHYGSTPSSDEEFNTENHYKDSKKVFGGDDEVNDEETRVITDSAIYDNVPNPVYPTDGAPMLRLGDQPRQIEIVRGKKMKFTRRPRGGKKVKDSGWVWKRTYHVLEGYKDKLYGDYVYSCLLKGTNPEVCDSLPETPVVFQVNGKDWLHDAFPFNETPGLPGTADFDTATALIKTGRNIAQPTGTLSRFDIPADSLVVCACEPAARMDLVFRILPGPGNYRVAGGRSHAPGGGIPSGTLLQLPTNQGAAAVAGDNSFWGQYLGNNGVFGSPGGHATGQWNPNVWNSARLDTAETNLFPVTDLGNLPQLNPCTWSSTYHESDPKFTTLGVYKHRCFVVDTVGAVASPNIDCASVPAWATTLPSNYSGYDGNALTREYTKILPDGVFTPGTHIQYFLRKSKLATPGVFAMVPDTNIVTPQSGEGALACDGTAVGSGSDDGHRWQQFSVLPDRWKDPAFGGAGLACMLYVDLNDGHGDERAWTAIAELIGATQLTKAGGHNGIHVPSLDASPNNPASFVRKHAGQPGTLWDKFDVRGIDDGLNGFAGSLGSRLANRSNMGYAAGKESRIAPTPEMLRTYYRLLYVASGNSNNLLLGPGVDRSQNDVVMIQDFLTTNAGTPRPRGIYVQGDAFVESATQTADPAHLALLNTYLGLSLRSSNYVTLSGNGSTCIDLLADAPTASKYGIRSQGGATNDVFQLNGGIPEAVAVSFYEDYGANGPYIASVHKPATPLRNWVALTDGWDLKRMKSRYCINEAGRLAYMYHTLNNVFAPVCVATGPPITTVEVPLDETPRANFVHLLNNPVRVGDAIMEFGLVRASRVQIRVYDIAGRVVSEVVNRDFTSGVHRLRWNGTDSRGRRVNAGVFFVRTEFPGQRFTRTSKVLIMK